MAAATTDVPHRPASVNPESQERQSRAAATFTAPLLEKESRQELGRETEREEGRVKGLSSDQSPVRLLGPQEKLRLETYCHTGEKAFPCSQPHCPKAFVSKYKLLRHMATHSQQKTHQCSFCEKMFHRKDHLKNHLQTHDPNKEAFRCEECGKRYHTKLGYRRHAAMHSAASGDLTCKVCLLGCESTAALLEHLRGHSGKPPVAGGTRERRHPCAHCDRRFYTRKDVRRHLVVHTGRKDFLCPHCAQRFGRKDHLTRHAKKSHPQEPLVSKAELTPPPNMIKEELSQLACGGPPRGHSGGKPYSGVFPMGLYDPHLPPAHTPPGMGCHMEPTCGPSHPSAPLALPIPMSHPQHHHHHLQQQQPQHPPPLSAPPTAKYQPGSTSAYLKMEMESFLMDLQSGLPMSTLPEPQALPPAPPPVPPPVPSSDGPEALCGDSLLSKGPPECPTSMDFSHLLGFLPLNLPPYSTPMSTGGLVMGYAATASSSSASSSSSSSHTTETLVTPLTTVQVPSQDSLPSLPLGFSPTLSATTLPRFHQAFQ